MSKIKNNLTGMQFNHWTVLEEIGKGKVLCQCDCENRTVKEVYKQALLSGRSKSCGCIGKMQYKDKNIIKFYPGYKIHDWEILEDLGGDKFLARCSCGKKVEVYRANVIRGTHKSCGHSNRANYVGSTFGEWKVLSKVDSERYLCICSCGTERIVYIKTLKEGRSKSCGCMGSKHRKNTLNSKLQKLVGLKINEWTVIEVLDNQSLICKCSCGEERRIHKRSLLNGTSRSCGCKSSEFSLHTLISTYGDIAGTRVNKPRELWQIEILRSKDKISNLIQSFDGKPSVRELSKILDISEYHVARTLKKYDMFEDVTHESTRSNFESEVANFVIVNSQSDVILNSKNILGGLELDIYIPNLKLAIECNGDYWHSDIYKDKYYHYKKTLRCKKQGIQLIHIFEYEWRDPRRREILKSMIKYKLGMTHSIYARDTKLTELSKDEAYNFLNDNHLQGYINANIHFGLKYKDGIVAIMSFGTPRFSNEYQYELLRACCTKDLNVVGAFSKLFKYFLKSYNPDNIITYSDLSKFNTEVYNKLCFEYMCVTDPNYVWSNGNKVLSRYQTQKNRLVSLGLGDEYMSELEIMDSLGYYKIYDSGNAKYIWNKNRKEV